MATFRETPYSVFNYLVNLGDGSEGDIAGGFSEVSGLNAEVTVAEYRNGNSKVNYVQKIPAIQLYISSFEFLYKSDSYPAAASQVKVFLTTFYIGKYFSGATYAMSLVV